MVNQSKDGPLKTLYAVNIQNNSFMQTAEGTFK